MKKKPVKLSIFYNLTSQYSKNNKVTPKLLKCNKMSLIFLYSYNTLILLTNKIIVKKKKLNNFFKIQKNNGLINKKKKSFLK